MEPMYTVEAFRQEQGWNLHIEGGTWITHSETLGEEALLAVRRHLLDQQAPHAASASIMITIAEQIYSG